MNTCLVASQMCCCQQTRIFTKFEFRPCILTPLIKFGKSRAIGVTFCAGKARVIQVGGGSRDLYYYPKDTVLVTAISPKLNKGEVP